MLVKFKPASWEKDFVVVDSSEIYSQGRDICLYRYGGITWEVDDATLKYLENVWKHEGMRRVKFACYTDQFEMGWYDGVNVFDDNGRKRDVIQIELITYEMKGTK